MSAPVSPDLIRGWFAAAMSRMYAAEVPLYATLLDIVAETNRDAGEPRLAVERHGAVRVGTADELASLARLFAVMGMAPVGYYDLAPAGVPVHSTAFRPINEASLAANPFRIFTSLLRLELIADPGLRAEAAAILVGRRIVSPEALALIAQAEAEGGLCEDDARAFVAAALETFRWHGRAIVEAATYRRLHAAHPLVADVVCFPGPHINHLTPRTLDIDAAQVAMMAHGLPAKAAIEGPPHRAVPILLRQTSFRALAEHVDLAGEAGTHTARFGEIEQRGAALTPAGRALCDTLLGEAQAPGGDLARSFARFPDDAEALRSEPLAYFRYEPTGRPTPADADLDTLVARGAVNATPITYEDFLPVSAAGIFRSNLGGEAGPALDESGEARGVFEAALGRAPRDPFALYADEERRSLARVREQFGLVEAG